MNKLLIKQIRIEGSIAYVPLTKGYEAIIDAADVALVEKFNWYPAIGRHTVYALANGPRQNGKGKTIRLHRLITSALDGVDVDHRDGDGLNNRRKNLREATTSQNQCNRRIRADNRSGVKGVYWHSQAKKWHAQITLNGKNKSLGVYNNIADAAAAYAKGSASLHGEFGRLE